LDDAIEAAGDGLPDPSTTVQLEAVVSTLDAVYGWHNGGDKVEQPPKFGTDEYIARSLKHYSSNL
jgi:hypothetical protein